MTTPPSVAISGVAAVFHFDSTPPGSKDSQTSLAAIAKNKAINPSLTTCSSEYPSPWVPGINDVCNSWWYEAVLVLAQMRAKTEPPISSSEFSRRNLPAWSKRAFGDVKGSDIVLAEWDGVSLGS
jgi:hypothetical protein